MANGVKVEGEDGRNEKKSIEVIRCLILLLHLFRLFFIVYLNPSILKKFRLLFVFERVCK